MASDWFYKADTGYRISTNYTRGGNAPRLVIVHIMAGYLAGTDSWFDNPQAQASAHFGVGKNGAIHQYVALSDQAWHAAAANSYAIGIENEGFGGDKLTAAQIESNAQILAWVSKQYNSVNLWMNTKPFTGSGLSYHGAGGQAWGGHTSCPGQAVVNQLPAILDRAKTIANPPAPPPSTPEYAANPVTGLRVVEERYTQVDLDWTWAARAKGGYDVTYDAANHDKKTKHATSANITLNKLARNTTYTASVIAQPAASGAKPATIQFTTN